MKRIATLSVLAATAAVTATAALAAGAGTAPARTLTLFEDVGHESSTLIDNAPRSPAADPDAPGFRLSPGDELVARTPVLARAGGARVGTLYSHAVVASGARFERAVLQAQVILALRDGTIALTGLVGRSAHPLAVVGGTGAHEGARGRATERETAAGAELTVALLP